MKDVITKTIASIEEAIRSGNKALARHELRLLVKKRLQRPHRLPIARLARRAGLVNLGVRLLNPVVRPHQRQPVEATAQEIAEYAACLIFIGATEEAMRLLEPLDTGREPEVLLFRTYGLVSQWEYGSTIPLLEAYLQSDITPYQRLTGQANLAAALLAERRIPEAERLLEALREAARSPGYSLLASVVLELSSRCAFLKNDWQGVEESLHAVEKTLGDRNDHQLFLARKWHAFVGLTQSPTSELARRAVTTLREEAFRREDWETARECDRYLAVRCQDEGLLARVSGHFRRRRAGT